MGKVVIGVDPHKRSNTALVLDAQERVLARQRFTNDRDGHRELKRFARAWRDRTWAVEGARGVGLGLVSDWPLKASMSSTSRPSCPPGSAPSGLLQVRLTPGEW
jgi:hypothetical protein